MEMDNPLMEPAFHMGPTRFSLGCLIVAIFAMGITEYKRGMEMSKKKSIYDSGTTKGSAPRTSDRKRYEDNWEKIFGKKKEKKKDVEKKDSNS